MRPRVIAKYPHISTKWRCWYSESSDECYRRVPSTGQNEWIIIAERTLLYSSCAAITINMSQGKLLDRRIRMPNSQLGHRALRKLENFKFVMFLEEGIFTRCISQVVIEAFVS